MGSYHKWEIYALERREVKDEMDRARIHNRMMYVLTGEPRYQVESLVAGGQTTQRKIQERKRKRRRGFHHRPDRTLNEQRKRRAAAQRADASREAELHPLMAATALKEEVKEPMEVDEIHQEDAHTALVEEDDQGSDYDVDQYLDDPSKYLLI